MLLTARADEDNSGAPYTLTPTVLPVLLEVPGLTGAGLPRGTTWSALVNQKKPLPPVPLLSAPSRGPVLS